MGPGDAVALADGDRHAANDPVIDRRQDRNPDRQQEENSKGNHHLAVDHHVLGIVADDQSAQRRPVHAGARARPLNGEKDQGKQCATRHGGENFVKGRQDSPPDPNLRSWISPARRKTAHAFPGRYLPT